MIGFFVHRRNIYFLLFLMAKNREECDGFFAIPSRHENSAEESKCSTLDTLAY
jgi:hypothetical protein